MHATRRQRRSRWCQPAAAGAALGLGALASAQPSTPAQFLEAVNARWANTPDAERAERVLLPAIATMDPAPATLRGEPERALMLQPGDPEWAAVESWALGPSQREALKAFERVTAADSRFAFALGYGKEAAPSDIVAARLHIVVGEPPILAAMQPLYLEGLASLADLVVVEASRLADAQQTAQGADLTIRLLRLGRMLADREFAVEKQAGLLLMRGAIEATLDLLYSHPGGVNAEQARSLIEQLDPDKVRIDRILPPSADRLALRQLALESFIERDGPDPQRFPAYAALASARDPLLAIARADWWRRAAERHAGYFETLDAIDKVFNDWELRWSLDPRDSILFSPSEYRRLDPAKLSLIVATAVDQEGLMEERLRLRTTLLGARLAIGAVGYRAERGQWPRPLVAIRPRFVRELPLDPYALRSRAQPYSYFVPIRDQVRGPRELPKPHTVTVVGTAAQHALGQPSRLEQWRDALQLDEISRDPTAVASQLPRVGGLLQMLAGLGFTPGNAEQLLGGDLSEHLPRIARLLNLRESETDLVAPVLKSLFLQSNEFRGMYSELVRQGLGNRRIEQFSGEQARILLLEIGRAVQQVRLDRLSEGATTFSVSLDDSTFVLYSVGPDLQADWATSVGPLGADELIWPPLASLYRQHAREEGEQPK